MLKPRFRVFAGANGSGKTFLFNHLKQSGYIHTEIYVSADRIEAGIIKKPVFNFNSYRVKVSEEEFHSHILHSGLFINKIKDSSFLENFSLSRGKLSINIPKSLINSYHASFIASYLVEKLLASGQSLCFETVMSHISKVQIIHLAKEFGYKTYLYFVFTDNVDLNVTRVKLRVKSGQHNVDEDLIRSRYPRTFDLLPQALQEVDEAYVIDNSTFEIQVVAEKKNNRLEIQEEASAVIKPFLKL